MCAALLCCAGILDGTEPCGTGSQPMRFSARHIEANGVGYNQGYTTLELMTGWLNPSAYLYGDFRGHVFNGGTFALNAGLGYRQQVGRRIYGGLAYYDWRQTNRLHYNQISAGFETLGTRWDFRLNGYLPLGSPQSKGYHASFDSFAGNQLYLKKTYQFSMYGANAEAAYHYQPAKNFEIYSALGPYYFGRRGTNAYGGQFRLMAKYKDYISAEGTISYDSVFKDTYQGQLVFSIPFGPKKEISREEGAPSCADLALLQDRLVQPVVRNEIVVLDTKHKSYLAINPLTGLPWTFLFVDNTSHSAGTFESPFSTLADAIGASVAGDAIYIYPGDGTTTGLNAGNYQLLDLQFLLGAGIPQTVPTQFGPISIPAQASSYPSLDAASMTPVVLLANSNTVSGLSITSDGGDSDLTYCIGTSSTCLDPTITYNILDAKAAGVGINIQLIDGTIICNNNMFTTSDSDASAGAIISSLSATFNATVANNVFDGYFSNTTIDPDFGGVSLSVYPGGESGQIAVFNNQFYSMFEGLTVFAYEGTHATALVQGNAFYNASPPDNAWPTCMVAATNTATLNATVSSNTFVDCVAQTLYVVAYTSSNVTATVENNHTTGCGTSSGSFFPNPTICQARNSATMQVQSTKNVSLNDIPDLYHCRNTTSSMCLSLTDCYSQSGYQLTNATTGVFNLEPLQGNTGTVTESGTITSRPVGYCSDQ